MPGTHKPDLILLDMQMPVMDGLQAARLLKADPETSAIKILAVTSFAMKGDRERILAAGCDEYMAKPIDTRPAPRPGPAAPGSRRAPMDPSAEHPLRRRRARQPQPPGGPPRAQGIPRSSRPATARRPWRRLARERVDLVLLDVMMPVMDGFEVCQTIKGDDRTRGIPVVLLTALSGREDRIQGIESGADDFISKPFDKGEVLARIQMLLKVKALNERLKGAYDNILGLVAVGGELIRAFDPLTFDFRTSVDAFVAQIVRRSDSDSGKAEVALVGFPAGGGGWSWRMYRASGGEVAKAKVDLEIPEQVLSCPDSRLVFYNMPDLQTGEGSWLSVSLQPLGTDLQNAVCYLSPDLFVLLLNFGKEVSAYDATVLDSLVTQSLFLRSLAIQVSETENAFTYTVQALARAAEANDQDTGNHIQRLGEYCAAIAEVMGLPQAFVRDIRLQAQMHDVGKIHIHPDIIGKKGGPDARGVGGDAEAHPLRRHDPRRAPSLRHGEEPDHEPPREMGRERLSLRPKGRGDPPRGKDRGHRGPVRRPAGARAPTRPPSATKRPWRSSRPAREGPPPTTLTPASWPPSNPSTSTSRPSSTGFRTEVLPICLQCQRYLLLP